MALLLFPRVGTAENVMTQTQCREGFVAFSELIDEAPPANGLLVEVTDDGWCRLEENDGDVLWRAEGLERFLNGKLAPIALEAEFHDIDTAHVYGLGALGLDDVSENLFKFSIRQIPGEKKLVGEHVVVDFGDVGRLVMSFRANGVDLSSHQTAMASIGTFRAVEVALELDVKQRLAKAFLTSVQQEQRTEADFLEIVAGIPGVSLSGKSRAALERFSSEWVQSGGRLILRARSQAGVGLLQLRAGTFWLKTGNPISKSLGVWLSGVTVEADWIPAAVETQE
ncbi:hypothetical protein RXV86_01470 [Alisedimentitalea sp. MJ-SS2]|uniref:hypothetical protein n=1 Tax=Aliisedimentitalea sp. MJ-SS2 TaxID=3049795 RepID=UPI00290B7ED7|nr:hypothetical protein [Alisedimentitalea sp. MJ-SS2]MDU8926045.1 hypothetical protein [Alisedimentitalea sp. MJ-SS2]